MHKKIKKMKSVIQNKEAGQCYLCRLLDRDYSIKPIREEHHVMGGTANRRLSEKYGLKVYLCLNHHRFGPKAVHKNAEVAELLHKEAQKAFLWIYPNLDFRKIFGKNYLTEYDLNEMAYEDNEKFRRYVDRYCKNRGITTAEALEHEIVTDVRLEYEGHINKDFSEQTGQRSEG